MTRQHSCSMCSRRHRVHLQWVFAAEQANWRYRCTADTQRQFSSTVLADMRCSFFNLWLGCAGLLQDSQLKARRVILQLQFQRFWRCE
jgi:hypothetical protein